MFDELAKLPISQLLGLSVLGAFVTTIGSLIALLIKEYLFVRSFEMWKSRQAANQVYRKYRDPILLSAQELFYRIDEICQEFPASFLRSELLDQNPIRMENNSADDLYYQVYKLTSTIYRLCAFLGWLELYRQEIVFLDTGRSRHNQRLHSCIQMVRSDLADGHLNTASDWIDWTDQPIFREELRAIGEVMITESAGKSTIVGYSQFCDLFTMSGEGREHRWLRQVNSFLTDQVSDGKDFRLVRLQRLCVHLVNLIELLQQNPLSKEIKDRRDIYQRLI